MYHNRLPVYAFINEFQLYFVHLLYHLLYIYAIFYRKLPILIFKRAFNVYEVHEFRVQGTLAVRARCMGSYT